VIEPGEWRSSQPIVFGGESLEAAAREVYNDPAKRDVLIRSLMSVDEPSGAMDSDEEEEADELGPTFSDTAAYEIAEFEAAADAVGTPYAGDQTEIEGLAGGDALESKSDHEEAAVDITEPEEESETDRLHQDFDLRSVGEHSEGASAILGEVLSRATSVRATSVGSQVRVLSELL
jgi:hypothetical protein